MSAAERVRRSGFCLAEMFTFECRLMVKTPLIRLPPRDAKRAKKEYSEYTYKHFEKRGFTTVFAGSTLPPPFPFTPVLMAAGVMQYPRKKFFSALTAGRGVRFFAVAHLRRIYGQQMIGFFSLHYPPVLYILIALAVTAGIGALVYFKWYRPKAQREERERGEQVENLPVPGRHPRDREGGSPQDQRERVNHHSA
jgi:hypothetical protein